MSTQVTHYDSSSAFKPVTACGISLHVWFTRRPQNVTSAAREVTCKRCAKKIA